MAKNLTLTAILVFVIGVCFSQNDIADSIRNEFLKATSDTSRVMALAELSDYYKFNRPDSSIFYGNKALRLAREINFPEGELRTYQSVILAYNKLGNISKSLQLNLQAIKIAERNNLKQELYNKLFLMGNIYSLSGNSRKAIVPAR